MSESWDKRRVPWLGGRRVPMLEEVLNDLVKQGKIEAWLPPSFNSPCSQVLTGEVVGVELDVLDALREKIKPPIQPPAQPI